MKYNQRLKTMTIQRLAQRYLEYFEQDSRDNGDRFYKTKADTPPEVISLIKEAHGDMFPDDHKYEYITDALEFISSCDDPEEPEIESDPYYNDLLRWLSSDLNRTEYIDEYVQEFGLPEVGEFQIMNLISLGQWKEKEEVYWSVFKSLQEILNEQEDNEEDEDE